MENSGEIKIRALPRGDEVSEQKKTVEDKPKPKKSPRWIIYVGTVCLSLALLVGAFRHSEKAPHPTAGKVDLASTSGRINESVTRHLQETEIQREMMVRNREMENLPFKNAINEPSSDEYSELPDTHTYGVQMEGDDSAARVYEDLHGDPEHYADTLPVDKINARLANRKWLTEMERAEKIQFIGNFIRSAYDRGYEVEIDQNLIVTGVKKINRSKTLDINQVIDRLAKGQQPGS